MKIRTETNDTEEKNRESNKTKNWPLKRSQKLINLYVVLLRKKKKTYFTNDRNERGVISTD